MGTPKAGLLGGLAAWLAGVPCRAYTLYGLRLETARGLCRRLLWAAERCACLLANRVVCVSPSLHRRVTELRIANREKLILLASGSANGVDAQRFASSPERSLAAQRRREELAIPQDAPVIGFVGRLTYDKGLVELMAAYRSLKDAFPDLRLLLVGPSETGDPLPEPVVAAIETDPRVIHVGFVDDSSVYYHLMDCLALPSHREGFPSVALEAAAAGKPVVAASATGSVDAVVDGVTGLMTPVGDVLALSNALARLLDDPAARLRLGKAGQERVRESFEPLRLWEDLVLLYQKLLARSARPIAGRSSSLPEKCHGLRQ